MRTRPFPPHAAKSTFEACVESYSTYKTEALKLRLRPIASLIEKAEAEFLSAARSAQFQVVKSSDIVGGSVGKKEMVALYKEKLVGSAEGRIIYDALLGSPADRCPLCGHRDVETLDHYLDKALYPALAVTPVNLVPACSKCNHSKNGHHPTMEEEFTIHPYFDNLGQCTWLYATVKETSPPAFVYRLEPPQSWSGVLAARTKKHFKVFKLSPLYAAQAAQELQNIRWQLGEIHSRAGASGVQVHLQEGATSRRNADPNSWQTAMYTAMAANTWFCDGGFKVA